jgi:hypothetical protein
MASSSGGRWEADEDSTGFDGQQGGTGPAVLHEGSLKKYAIGKRCVGEWCKVKKWLE